MFKYEEIESVKGLVDVINLYKGSLYHEISKFDMQSKQDLLRNFMRLQLNVRSFWYSSIWTGLRIFSHVILDC